MSLKDDMHYLRGVLAEAGFEGVEVYHRDSKNTLVAIDCGDVIRDSLDQIKGRIFKLWRATDADAVTMLTDGDQILAILDMQDLLDSMSAGNFFQAFGLRAADISEED